MKRIAVWGASGFAGARLCAAAEAKQWMVRRLGRTELPFDASTETMAAALRGSELVFHCAGKSGDADHAGYADAAARLARACAGSAVRRLVYLSTVAVYGPQRAGTVGTGTPLLGSSAYALSRVDAELAIKAALSGTGCSWCIVRVPMLLGQGMPGTALRRLARWARLGLFPHPGPQDAVLACLGVHRLAALLVRLPESGNCTLQFSDHLRWIDITRRAGALHGRRVLRLPLPRLWGRFEALAATTRYVDDSQRVNEPSQLPATLEDLDAALRP